LQRPLLSHMKLVYSPLMRTKQESQFLIPGGLVITAHISAVTCTRTVCHCAYRFDRVWFLAVQWHSAAMCTSPAILHISPYNSRYGWNYEQSVL